jgi:hypothetical protein
MVQDLLSYVLVKKLKALEDNLKTWNEQAFW